MKANAKSSPRVLLTSGVSILIALSLTGTSRAVPQASITWGAAQNISGPSDVSTSGTLVGAFNLGLTGVPSTTVNGITFSPFAITGGGGSGTVTNGNFSFFFNSSQGSNTAFGSSSAPFSALPSAYQALLQSGIADYNASGFQLNLNSLTVGQTYTFEWWDNDSGEFLPPHSTSATAGNEVTISGNTGSAVGALGQYDIGTFTATTTTENIAFTPNGAPPEMNAFELRSAAVPEPSSTLLMLGSGAMLLTRRRRTPAR